MTLDRDLQEEICRYKQETENPRQWAQCVQRSWGEREHNDSGVGRMPPPDPFDNLQAPVDSQG